MMPNLNILCFLLYGIISSYLTVCIGQPSRDEGRVEFQAEKNINGILEFTNLVIDNSQVYIGARNRLYQLDSNLVNYFSPITTGPVADGIVCHNQNVDKLTDNLNKLLLIDNQNDRIIICGSIEQGICELRQLGNIRNRLSNYNISDIDARRHVAASGNLSTVAFLVTLDANQNFMFVGSSKTHKDVKDCEYTTSFTISRRSLPIENSSPDMFSSYHKSFDFSNNAAIKMDEKNFADQGYRLTFIDGFSSGLTGYFIATHSSSPQSDSNTPNGATYISQICLEDSYMYSYLELPLECTAEGFRYTKAVASRTAKIGSLLRNRLNVSPTNHETALDVVFISFKRENDQPGSAVCMFSLREIEQKFLKLVKRCMKYNTGLKPQSVSWIADSEDLSCLGNFNVSTPVCHTNRHINIWEVVKYLEGNVYSANAVYESKTTVVTAIEVVRTLDDLHTVAFLGTEDGFLMKVQLDTETMDNVVYERIPINPINIASTLRPSASYSSVKYIRLGNENGINAQRIYAMTPSAVVGVPLFNCSQYQTCSSCLNSKDPFCGWCTLEAKCTSSSNCQYYSSANPLHFIDAGGICPSLTPSEPNPLVLTVSQSEVQISLHGNSIPLLKGEYFCNFGDFYPRRVTRVENTNAAGNSALSIQCFTPPYDVIPKFPSNEGHLTIPLSLVYGVGKSSTVIASTEFTFYNCSVFTSCMTCVRSHFNCSWCLDENICAYQSTSYCPQSGVTRSDRCPQLLSHAESNKVYLAAGEMKDIRLPARNLPDNWLSFTCQVNFNNGQAAVSYDGVRGIGGSHILCRQLSQGPVCLLQCGVFGECRKISHEVYHIDLTEAENVFNDNFIAFAPYGHKGVTGQSSKDYAAPYTLSLAGSLPDSVRKSKASVLVTTTTNTNGNSQKIVLDNPKDLSIEVYRCQLGEHENCGQCLQSPSEWLCGWCDAKDECTLSRDCVNWLQDGTQGTCRNPQITDFSPKTAPFGSNATVITLYGLNFDPRGRMSVTIAGVHCGVISSTCCELQCVPSPRRPTSGTVKLCTNKFNCLPADAYTAFSKEKFHFVDPKITSFAPSTGLKGWGSTVIVYGENLDAGNVAVVSVAGSPCVVERRSNAELQCRLPCIGTKRRRDIAKSALERISRSKRSFSDSENRLVATFDGMHRVAKTGEYVFEESVSLRTIDPACTIRSGGLPLTLHGRNLNLVPEPRMVVRLEDGSLYRGVCEKFEGESIKCSSPNVATSSVFRTEDGDRSATVGIYNLGCQSQTHWFESPLRFTPDPALDIFDDETQTKVYRGVAVYITGKNLCPDSFHCELSAVRVLIGQDKVCNVTRLVMDQITCLPQPSDEEGSYLVQVFIGGYHQEIGYLEYTKETAFPLYVLGIIAGIVLVVLCIIIVVVCVYRKRAKASDEELKNVHMQMDLMDAKVAKICKEAFAELQTDMCQLDTYAGGAGIPYLKYPSYLMRVLFPDPSTSDLQYSLLYSTMKPNASFGNKRNLYSRAPAGMDKLDQLLGNKIFLLSLIKTLEKQQTFLVKDRAKVAGLLMIILHNRLQYATEILEHLLADLINRNMESRSHPKLLLRRTESVAEKMLTHWFSILLHRFMEECAGEPLYTLFRAIKQQVDKGPLDGFTSEARYSLSEDKLLRQSMDPETIFLQVMNYLEDEDQPEFTVKVLGCDSISQVKRKILDVGYMGVGYSQRPHPEDVDLEVMQSKLLPLMLHDEDASSEVEAEWKRVNTLDHYEIKSGTCLSLIPKKDPSVFNYSLVTAPSKTSLFKTNGTGNRGFSSGDSITSSLPRHRQGLGTLTLSHNTAKKWHLAKPNDQDQPEGVDRGSKMVSEVYLTRLLTTKGTIQKYVDDLFETIFSVVQRGHDLPLAVKHMFDFLDHQADIHGITDPEVVHTWKSNCLPLRFWVNLIKNPEFIFDIDKSPIVDCYLSVIAQAFMDSCSTADYKLGKDSPSNKLLYAKEIPEYREWVKKYYAGISSRSKLNPRDLARFLQDESGMHSDEFNRPAALSQLFLYIQKYADAILLQLESEPEANRQGLARQLETLTRAVTGTT